MNQADILNIVAGVKPLINQAISEELSRVGYRAKVRRPAAASDDQEFQLASPVEKYERRATAVRELDQRIGLAEHYARQRKAEILDLASAQAAENVVAARREGKRLDHLRETQRLVEELSESPARYQRAVSEQREHPTRYGRQPIPGGKNSDRPYKYVPVIDRIRKIARERWEAGGRSERLAQVELDVSRQVYAAMAAKASGSVKEAYAVLSGWNQDEMYEFGALDQSIMAKASDLAAQRAPGGRSFRAELQKAIAELTREHMDSLAGRIGL